MLNQQFVRENHEIVLKNLTFRKDEDKKKLVYEFLEADEKWRELKHKIDNLRKERNKLSEKINQAKKENKTKEEITLIIQDAKKIPAQLKELEEKEKKLANEIKFILMRLPNILHESVPYGKSDEDNVTIKEVGEKTKFDFEPKNHIEILELLGSDFDRSTKISGAGFYMFKGQVALLNQALIQFAINHLSKKGYVYTEPPVMLRKEAVEGVTDLNAFKDEVYKIEGEDHYMIATSEHPLMAQFSNEVLDEKKLPLKMCAYSMCFRKEIGSHGIDTKGIYRTHQFNKVEQVIICKQEDSWKLHEELLNNTEEIFRALEIPYQIVNICTGDIGIVASKKYDIEAWMPRRNTYGEVASCSNCTDYQATRLNIKYKAKDEINKKMVNKYIHSLNNTAIATGRALVAILENHQNEDGSVNIPKVLQPYMNGITKLTPMQHH